MSPYIFWVFTGDWRPIFFISYSSVHRLYWQFMFRHVDTKTKPHLRIDGVHFLNMKKQNLVSIGVCFIWTFHFHTDVFGLFCCKYIEFHTDLS